MEKEKQPQPAPPKFSPAIQRLLDEVKNPTPRGTYDRAHMRHNRS